MRCQHGPPFSTAWLHESIFWISSKQETTDNGEESTDFNLLVEKHSNFVYDVAYRMMGNHEDAKDVVQDTFLSAYRAFDRFCGESRVTIGYTGSQ